MSFPDASFDVILSNLCLHNIYDSPTRHRVLAEIILKPQIGQLIHNLSSTDDGHRS